MRSSRLLMFMTIIMLMAMVVAGPVAVGAVMVVLVVDTIGTYEPVGDGKTMLHAIAEISRLRW